MRRKRIGILVVCTVAALGVAVWWHVTARSGPAPAGGLTFYGNVDIRQVDLAFRVGGRLVEVFVEEGDVLKPGDRVARLDPEPFAEAVTWREAELAQAEALLEKLRNGSRTQDVRLAEAQLSEAQATLKALDLQQRRTQKLVDEVQGAVSLQTLDEVTASKDAALARMAGAEQALSLAVEGSRREDVTAAEKARDAAAAQLAQARTQLADTLVVSPARGTVLARVREPGSMVAAGETVLTLNKSDPVWVRAYLPEPQLGRIRPGMPARIYADAFPENPIEGRIGFISPEAEFTPKSVETPELRTQLVYRFRVIATDPENRLRQGMPVTVKVDVGAGAGDGRHG